MPREGGVGGDAGEHEVGGEEYSLIGELQAAGGFLLGVIFLSLPGGTAEVPSIFGGGGGFELGVSGFPFFRCGQTATEKAGDVDGGPGTQLLHRHVGGWGGGGGAGGIVGISVIAHLRVLEEPRGIGDEFPAVDFPDARAIPGIAGGIEPVGFITGFTGVLDIAETFRIGDSIGEKSKRHFGGTKINGFGSDLKADEFEGVFGSGFGGEIEETDVGIGAGVLLPTGEFGASAGGGGFFVGLLERFGHAGEEVFDVGVLVYGSGHGIDGVDEGLGDLFEVGFLEASVGLFAELVVGVVEDHAGVGLGIEGDVEGGATVEGGLDGGGGGKSVGPVMPAGGTLRGHLGRDGGDAGGFEDAGLGGAFEEVLDVGFEFVFIIEDGEGFGDGRVGEFAPGGESDFRSGGVAVVGERFVVGDVVECEEIVDAGGDGLEGGGDVGVVEENGAALLPLGVEIAPSGRACGRFVLLEVELIEAGFDGGEVSDEGEGVKAEVIEGAEAVGLEGLVGGVGDLREVIGPLEAGVGHEFVEGVRAIFSGDLGGDDVAPVGAGDVGETGNDDGNLFIKVFVDGFEIFKFLIHGFERAVVFEILRGGGDFGEECRPGFLPLFGDDGRGFNEGRGSEEGFLLGDVISGIDLVGGDGVVAITGEGDEFFGGFGHEGLDLRFIFFDGGDGGKGGEFLLESVAALDEGGEFGILWVGVGNDFDHAILDVGKGFLPIDGGARIGFEFDVTLGDFGEVGVHVEGDFAIGGELGGGIFGEFRIDDFLIFAVEIGGKISHDFFDGGEGDGEGLDVVEGAGDGGGGLAGL